MPLHLRHNVVNVHDGCQGDVTFEILIAYCLITADTFVAISLAGSLALFQARIGASNPLDHLHHVFVMIAVLASVF